MRHLRTGEHANQHCYGAQEKNRARESGRGLQDERADGVVPGKPAALDEASTAACPLVADGHANAEQEIRRLGYRAQGGQHLLRLLETCPLI